MPGNVYVDSPVWPFGKMIMCHMVADNIDALHAMADKIGVSRRWFQDKPGFPHYDISKSKRELAVRNGAIELSWRELITLRKTGMISPRPAQKPCPADGSKERLMSI